MIVGAGPIGLACAISAQARGIDPLVVDAGAYRGFGSIWRGAASSGLISSTLAEFNYPELWLSITSAPGSSPSLRARGSRR